MVSAFLVGDGAGSEALVGSFDIKPEWLLGYSNGAMVLSDEAADAPAHRVVLPQRQARVTRQPLLRLLRLQLRLERLLQRLPRKARLPWVRRWPRQSELSKMLPSPTQKTIPSAQLPLLQRMFASRSHLRRSRP